MSSWESAARAWAALAGAQAEAAAPPAACLARRVREAVSELSRHAQCLMEYQGASVIGVALLAEALRRHSQLPRQVAGMPRLVQDAAGTYRSLAELRELQQPDVDLLVEQRRAQHADEGRVPYPSDVLTDDGDSDADDGDSDDDEEEEDCSNDSVGESPAWEEVEHAIRARARWIVETDIGALIAAEEADEDFGPRRGRPKQHAASRGPDFDQLCADEGTLRAALESNGAQWSGHALWLAGRVLDEFAVLRVGVPLAREAVAQEAQAAEDEAERPGQSKTSKRARTDDTEDAQIAHSKRRKDSALPSAA